MPVLELSAEALAPTRAELTCASIFATMLWPDDEPARRRWIETQTARFVADTLYGGNSAVAQSVAHQGLFDMALKATPPAVLDAEARPLYQRGTIAGETLLAAVGSFAHDGVLNLESLRRMQTAPARRGVAPSLDRSTAMLGRDWAYFGRVLPFWAAHAHATLGGYDFAPPCTPSRLLDFLCVAHAIALTGAHDVKPHRRREPVLDPRRLWSVPSGIHPKLAEIDRLFETMRRQSRD
jgi:hypothetical protein